MSKIKPLEKKYYRDEEGNITGYEYPDSQKTMDKINELVAAVNELTEES